MRIAILSSEKPENACARVRLRDVIKYLQPDVSFTWTGIEEAGAVDATDILKSADVVVVQRSFPRPRTMKMLQAALFESGKPVIYETDDLLTDLPTSHPEYATYARHRHLTLSCIANCDAVIVSTEVLKARHVPLNPRVYVFGNTLDKSSWQRPRPQQHGRSGRGPLTIGFCGSHTHVPDLEGIEVALERIQAHYGDRVRFSFFGCTTERLKRLPNLTYREGFISYSDYPALLQSLQLDIGLAPLMNNEFNANKSHIKYLEYAACGIPGIYSDLAPYKASVTHGRTGLLVGDTTDAWYEAIVQLIEQPDLSERIAMAAYEDVWARFATEAKAPDWLAIARATLEDFHSSSSAIPRSRSAMAQAMWELAVDYEQRLAEDEAALAQAQQRIDWLERRPLERALQTAKGVFLNR